MGQIARLLSFVRTKVNGSNITDVKINPGGGANITAQHFPPPGDDAHPLTTDYVVSFGVRGTGREVVVGYADPLNVAQAQPGDKRIYARGSSGAVVAEVWLKNDGSISGFNTNGSFTLESGGDFVVNGVTIDVNGVITTPSAIISPSVVAGGKELTGHVHKAGTPPGDTGANE